MKNYFNFPFLIKNFITTGSRLSFLIMSIGVGLIVGTTACRINDVPKSEQNKQPEVKVIAPGLKKDNPVSSSKDTPAPKVSFETQSENMPRHFPEPTSPAPNLPYLLYGEWGLTKDTRGNITVGLYAMHNPGYNKDLNIKKGATPRLISFSCKATDYSIKVKNPLTDAYLTIGSSKAISVSFNDGKNVYVLDSAEDLNRVITLLDIAEEFMVIDEKGKVYKIKVAPKKSIALPCRSLK